MPTEAEFANLKRMLNGQGVLERASRIKLADGSDAIEMVLSQELEHGGGLVVYTLAVPKDDQAFLMSYIVLDEAGDTAGWTALTSSVRFDDSGIPIWVFAGAGVLALGSSCSCSAATATNPSDVS